MGACSGDTPKAGGLGTWLLGFCFSGLSFPTYIYFKRLKERGNRDGGWC